MKFARSTRWVAASAALLVVLFLFRPGVGELRMRISRSIGQALGRRVTIESVRLRALPRPGFDLQDLVIYDDPAFSAEPMIRAQDVSAAIRIRSLFRGKLEIANLSANEPSINLVRNAAGQWNLAGLLERNAQIPAAPTEKAASERRPAFPYLEASSARVNFKFGQTKKSYALVNADVALWQDSENSWGARIKAAPVRTDFNLTDTGLLQVNATWRRAASLRETPIEIDAQWKNGQLGQITTLLTGKDRGWRGGVTSAAKLVGTPQALQIASQTAIEDFRRYDIAGNESLRLATTCSGKYDALTAILSDLLCQSPAGSGNLRVEGSLAVLEQFPAFDLTVAAEDLPLTSIVRLLRQAKRQIPASLTATGVLNAKFHGTRTATGNASSESIPPARWSGSGAATGVRLTSRAPSSVSAQSAETGNVEIVIGTIPLTLAAADSSRKTSAPLHPSATEPLDPDREEPSVRVGPLQLAVNGSQPVNAGGWLSKDAYRFFLRGDLELKDLFRLEDVIGLQVFHPAADGTARLDMNVFGPWQGFAPPLVVGNAQLKNVHAEVRGLNAPIEIASASLSLVSDSMKLERLLARTGNTHWNGGITAPRRCSAPGCTFEFDLTADQLSTADLAEWFTPPATKPPWYRILASSQSQGPSPMLAISARGNLHVSRFGLKKAMATQVSTRVEADHGKIALKSLRGQLLQGTHVGNWTIDLSNHESSKSAVQYRGVGALHDISLNQVGMLMNDAWITGTADGNFDLSGSGSSFREAVAGINGKIQFVMRNGSLPHIEIPASAGSLPVQRFIGDLRLKQGTWEFSAARLQSRDGIYDVNGTVSPSGAFDFVLTRGAEQSWLITGTLAKPRVLPGNRADAARTEAADASATKAQ